MLGPLDLNPHHFAERIIADSVAELLLGDAEPASDSCGR